MVVAYDYFGTEDVIIKQERHNCFVIQRRRNYVPFRIEVRQTLQDAEMVYENFLKR